MYSNWLLHHLEAVFVHISPGHFLKPQARVNFGLRDLVCDLIARTCVLTGLGLIKPMNL